MSSYSVEVVFQDGREHLVCERSFVGVILVNPINLSAHLEQIVDVIDDGERRVTHLRTLSITTTRQELNM